MECTQIDELLMDYLYQELAPEQADEFRAHLDSCDRCAREVQSFQGVREAVRELPVLEPSKALTAQLLHQAAEAKKPAFPWLKSLWELLQPRRTFYAVAAAASLVVVLFVGYAMQKGKVSRELVTDERVTSETATPLAQAPAPAAPAALPAPTAPAAPAEAPLGTTNADELKGPAVAKGLVGAESGARPIDTLTEKDGKLAAGKAGGGYPVRLDNDSVQREKAAGGDPGWIPDSSNAARLSDARRGGFGLGGRVDVPKDQSVQRPTRQVLDGERPRFADTAKQAPVPVRPPQAVTRGAQAAPVLNAPAGGGHAAGPRRIQLAQPQAMPPPAPAQAQVQKRSWQASPAAESPAPAKEEVAGYYRRQQAARPAAPAARPRTAESTAGTRDEGANDKAGDGHGFAQAPPDDRTRLRASVDYKNAMGVGCEKQIKLLEEFMTKYPWDSRVKEAKIRIAVCRARLTGRSEDVDDVLRNIEGDRQKKSLHEAEQRAAPDRYAPAPKAPAPISLERQTSYKARKVAPKPAAKPGVRPEPARATVKAPVRAGGEKAVATKAKGKAPAEAKPAAAAKAPAKAAPAAAAKAPAKGAPAAATAAKAKKAPAKADERRQPAAAPAATSK